MQPELKCPWCMAAKVFKVSRLPQESEEQPGSYYDILYSYRCDVCGKHGPEFRNNEQAAWDAFNNKQ